MSMVKEFRNKCQQKKGRSKWSISNDKKSCQHNSWTPLSAIIYSLINRILNGINWVLLAFLKLILPIRTLQELFKENIQCSVDRQWRLGKSIPFGKSITFWEIYTFLQHKKRFPKTSLMVHTIYVIHWHHKKFSLN